MKLELMGKVNDFIIFPYSFIMRKDDDDDDDEQQRRQQLFFT